MRKNYILDTNILIHDPNSVFHFVDNTIIIPIGVLTEIDKFKKEMSDRGYNARAIVRILDGLRTRNSLADGVPLDQGGRLRVYCEADALAVTNGHADNEILAVAQAVKRKEPDTPVIIVTKDINLRIRADAIGLRAEDYETDQVQLSELYSGQCEHSVPTEAIEQFRKTGRLDVADQGFTPNEYVMLRSTECSRTTALARVDVDARCLVTLREAEGTLWGIRPRNKEQYFAIDALLDDRLQMVTIMGKAGTGKTLLAMAAALHLSIRKRRYRGMLVCRPIFPLGRDLGYLPGDISQKLDPWLKPVVDTVDFLLDMGGPANGTNDVNALLRSGVVEIQPLTYIRGRSITNRFVVIDESQNLTPLEVKTIITRIGEDAKIVLTGDPYQIDNPYVDANSNGFSYLVNRFRSEGIAAHIELRKGERSPLAELAANLL